MDQVYDGPAAVVKPYLLRVVLGNSGPALGNQLGQVSTDGFERFNLFHAVLEQLFKNCVDWYGLVFGHLLGDDNDQALLMKQFDD